MTMEDPRINNLLNLLGHSSLYPPQQQAVSQGLLEGKNLLVTSPTASGKTLIAIMAAIKAFEKGMKVFYLTPLRALAMEGGPAETYLGVAFVGGPSEIMACESFYAELALAYWPDIAYEGLVLGATFTVREGPHIVGYGSVECVDRAT